MKLRIGFSSCPNDTYIFNALVNQLIKHDFELEITIADIKELNRLALDGSLDVVKVSYHAYAYMIEQYQILNSGSALGEGVGPLLISKNHKTLDQIDNAQIGIPGKYTTANFLMGYAYPNAKNKQVLLFSELEDAVLNDKVDLAVIIHENRFTYQKKGLIKVQDLGQYWEDNTSLSIPLGGIAIKRALGADLKRNFDDILRRSIEYAFANEAATMPYVRSYAQEMNDEIIKKHINLYVNHYSVELKSKGKQAILKLLNHVLKTDQQKLENNSIFIS